MAVCREGISDLYTNPSIYKENYRLLAARRNRPCDYVSQSSPPQGCMPCSNFAMRSCNHPDSAPEDALPSLGSDRILQTPSLSTENCLQSSVASHLLLQSRNDRTPSSPSLSLSQSVRESVILGRMYSLKTSLCRNGLALLFFKRKSARFYLLGNAAAPLTAIHCCSKFHISSTASGDK